MSLWSLSLCRLIPTYNRGEKMNYDQNSENRWLGVKRVYSTDDVARLRGSIHIEYTLAKMGAERLWNLLHSEEYIAALGALTGNQAVQQIQAGLKAVYLSGW